MFIIHFIVHIPTYTFAFIAGIDYNVTTQVFNLTIIAGRTAAPINVDIINDVIHEDHETFSIAITLLPSCLSLSLEYSQSTIRILDNDSMLSDIIIM